MFTNLPYIYEGEIIAVQENKQALDNGKIRYVCLVEVRNGSQIIVPNVIESSMFGGIADYFQRRARTSKDSGNKFAPSPASANNDARIGERVYIQFICGNLAKAIITGYAQHPNQTVEFDENFDNVPDDQVSAKPKAVLSYLGMRFDFKDTGVLRITHFGAPEIKFVDSTGVAGAIGAVTGLLSAATTGVKPNPAVTPAPASKTCYVEFHDEGGLEIRDSLGQLFDINTKDEKIFISNADRKSTEKEGGAAAAIGGLLGATSESITLSRKDESLVVQGRKLVSIKSSDKRTDETTGDHTHNIKGSEKISIFKDKTDEIQGNVTEKITMNYKQSIYGKSEVSVVGDVTESYKGKLAVDVIGETGITSVGAITVKTKIGATLKLDGAKVALGAAGTELLKVVSDTQQITIDILLQIVALTVTTAFGPSGPPINAAQFTQLSGKLTALKAKLDIITGSL